MSRNSLILYKSFVDAIQSVDDMAEQGRIYNAIANFALKGEEPNLQGVAKIIFEMAKPQIEANNKRYENGKKGGEFGKLGGRPKKQAPTEPPQEEKPKKEPKPKAEKPAKPQEDKIAFGELGNVKLTQTELEKLNAEYGEIVTKMAIDYLDAYIADKGYKSKSHYLAMRRWVFDAVAEKHQKRNKLANGGTNEDYFEGVAIDL